MIGLMPGGSNSISLERLELAVAAKQRVNAQATLELACGIANGVSGGDGWRKWADLMMEKMKR